MGGSKGGDLTGNSVPTGGVFDISVYYIPRRSYFITATCRAKCQRVRVWTSLSLLKGRY